MVPTYVYLLHVHILVVEQNLSEPGLGFAVIKCQYKADIIMVKDVIIWTIHDDKSIPGVN